MIMHLWGDKAGSPMSATHFGFGVGAIIAPQLAKSFLSPDTVDEDDDVITTLSPHDVTTLNGTDTGEVDYGSIEIPYSIVAGLATLFSLLVLAYFIKGPPRGFPQREGGKLTREKMAAMLKPSSCSPGDSCFGTTLFVLLFLYFAQASGLEGTFGELRVSSFPLLIQGSKSVTKLRFKQNQPSPEHPHG